MSNKIGITIDSGHYEKYNKGAIAGYYEGTAMFTLGGYLKTELLSYGIFDVFTTKNTVKENPSLLTRANVALNNGSTMLISLHTNGMNDSSIKGTLIFASVKRKAYSAAANQLTDAIATYLRSVNGITHNRGPQYVANTTDPLDYYGICRHGTTKNGLEHVYIMEHCFHSNPIECASINSDAKLKELAKVEAKAIYELLAPLYADPAKYTFFDSSTTAGVNVRATEDPNSLIITTLPNNTKIKVIQHNPNGMSKIAFRGCIRYISTAYITYPDGYSDGQKIPEVIREAVVEITTASLRVRSRPNTTSTILKNVTKGETLTVDLDQSTDTWYALRPAPISGYISAEYAEIISTNDINYVETPPKEEDIAPKVYATITPDVGLRLRSEKSTKATSLGTIPKNATIEVHHTDSDWSFVTYTPYGTGYVATEYIKIDRVTKEQQIIGFYTVDTAKLNVRSGAGTQYPIVGSVTKGTEIAVAATHGDWLELIVDDSAKSARFVAAQYTKKRIEYSAPTMSKDLADKLNTMIDQYNVDAIQWFTTLLKATMSSGYGYRTHPVTGAKESFHTGLDFSCSDATPIPSPVTGIVVMNFYDTSYGNLLVVEDVHDKTRHYFAHMKTKSLAALGQVVRRGDVIGYVGTTGSSTGSHLHYEIRKEPWKYQVNNTNPAIYEYQHW